jgi:flagellar biosynthetic protein FlhB
MAQSSKSDRTEKPTAKKRREAREKGQIARTRDLSQAASLAAVAAALLWTGHIGMGRLMATMANSLQLMGDGPQDLVAGTFVGVVVTSGQAVAFFVGPVALFVTVAVIFSQTIQGGWVFAPVALQPDWSRLSPINGLKRLALSRGWLDLVKTMSIVTVMAILSYKAVVSMLSDPYRLAGMAPVDSAMQAWDGARSLIWQAVILLIAVSLADYGIQRWRMTTSLKMTKREVRDDMRLTEGSPETKSRIRRIQRQMARRRMLSDVPKATVVITNPTHYAIALDYRRDEMPAPQVLAKGSGELARRIREIAREHGVPIVENKPLARALYRGAEIGDLIPPELFDAVAEVLVYLVRLKQVRL